MHENIFDELAEIEEEMFALLERMLLKNKRIMSKGMEERLDSEKKDMNFLTVHQNTPQKNISKITPSIIPLNKKLDLSIIETESKVIVTLPIKGTIQKLDIQVKGDLLSFSIQTSDEKKNIQGNMQSFYSSSQTVQEIVRLPAFVLQENVQSFYEKGILRIELQKQIREEENVAGDDYEN